MNCEQRRDMMPLLLVDALDPADAASLRAHMATGCTRCASYVAEADAMLNYLPFALDPVRPPASARDRLMRRVQEATPAAAALAARRNPRARLWLPGWVRKSLPAAIAASLVFVATVQVMLRQQREQEQTYKVQLADARHKNHEMSKANVFLTNEVQIANNLYTSPRQIRLEGRAQEAAHGVAFFVPERNAWRFRAFKLAQLASPTDAYQLWFETPYGRKVPTAKTFRPDETGDVRDIVVTLPADVGPVSKAFVTDEPSVGTQQPTGAVHLWGRVD